MSKSNDTTKTRELTEAELAAVTGGTGGTGGNPAIPMILGTGFLTGMFAGDGLGSAHAVCE